MPPGRFRIATVSAILALSIAAALVAHLVTSRDMAAVFKAEIIKIVECSKQEDAILCTQPSIRHMMTVGSAKEVMNALDGALEPMQCHYVGHVVGQQLYVRERSIERALEQCNRICDSACIHGVTGEAFAEEAGLGDPSESKYVDISRMSEVDLRRLGKTFCKSSETCHGVGHTIFQSAKNFEKSMALCREAAPENNVVPCYNGASMEYADILSDRNMRPVEGVQAPTKASLPSFCLLNSLAERRACFRYFPRVVQATLEPLGFTSQQSQDEVQKICQSFPKGDNRVACIPGIGTYSSYLIHTDYAAARKECDRFDKLQDKASCTLGQVFVAVGDRKEKIIAFCKSLPDPALKGSCYQDLFHFLYFVGMPIESTATLCGHDDPLCEASRKNYMLDSWEEIKKL